jgi:hypothetical protein
LPTEPFFKQLCLNHSFEKDGKHRCDNTALHPHTVFSVFSKHLLGEIEHRIAQLLLIDKGFKDKNCFLKGG